MKNLKTQRTNNDKLKKTMLQEYLPSAYLIVEAQTVDNTAPGASTHSFPYLKMNDRAYIFSHGNTTRQIEALC